MLKRVKRCLCSQTLTVYELKKVLFTFTSTSFHCLSLSLSVSIWISPFFLGPLVRLMDDRAGRERQYINYFAASLILIWLPESSGSAWGQRGYILTQPGSRINLKKKKKHNKENLKTPTASIYICFLLVNQVQEGVQ